MDQLTRLKAKRTATKQSATRAKNNLEVELKKQDPDFAAVQAYLDVLQSKELVLVNINEAMEPLFTAADELEKDHQQSLDYIDDLIVTQARGRQAIDLNKLTAIASAAAAALTTPIPSTSTQSSSSSTVSSPYTGTGATNAPTVATNPQNLQSTGLVNTSVISQAQVGNASTASFQHGATPTVRLPKLEIRRYSGLIEEWQDFWAHYQSAIHNNPTLSKTDKFTYLRSYLEGEALLSLKGLSLSDANYDSAIINLQDRFGRQEVIVNEHMFALLHLPAVQKSNDVQGLRRLYDTCMTHIRSLEDLQIVVQTYGSLLCPIITQCLPEDITLAFSRQYANSLQISELMDFLQREISSRERASALTRSAAPESDRKHAVQERRPPERFYSQRDNRKTKPLHGAAALSVNAYQRVCLYCSQSEHTTTQCTKLTVPEKKDVLLRRKRCFVCLRENHPSRNCMSRFQTCKKCQGRHHSSICDQLEDQRTAPNPASSEAVNQVAQMTAGVSKQDSTYVFLQTAVATAKRPNKEEGKKVRCLLDTGSHVTFIKESVSRALNLPIISEDVLETNNFGNATPQRVLRRRVQLELVSRHNSESKVLLEAYETPTICGAVFSVPGMEIAKEFQKRNLLMADTATVEVGTQEPYAIEVLIGANYLWAVASGKVERLSPTLIAMDTVFGWTLQGPASVASLGVGLNAITIMHVNTTVIPEEDAVSDQLRKFWELESFGIKDSDEDEERGKQILGKFSKTTSFNNGRYTVALPFKSGDHQLGDNFSVAKKRTLNLLNKLRGDPVRFQEYNTIIKEQLDTGVAERVDPSQKTGYPIYYFPHRSVTREASTSTRTRIVNDASSHALGVSSLNSCLEAGPNLNPELLDILLRFREKKVAFTADITKAFLQIEIQPEDRDALRFLWVNVDDPYVPQDRSIYRMTRVPFGATSSPFLLAATIRLHAQKYKEAYPEASQLLNDSMYVDDLVSNADSEKEALDLITNTITLLKEASMTLTKWQTNSPQLKEILTAKNLTTKPPALKTSFAPTKVLGLAWDNVNDVFTFVIDDLLDFIKDRKNTKRWVLKSVAKVFDPLGFISPFTVRAKILFQQLWEKGLSWDEELPDEENGIFEDWCCELRNLQEIAIPRHYFNEAVDLDPESLELHCFSDASPKAYAAVVYFKYRNKEGHYASTLVTSKSRVAPLKKLTLPRLELMGALLAAQLVKHLMIQLKIKPKKTLMWSDSKIALGWIKGRADRWKPFVSNRVREIQSVSDPILWHHCKGSENPADRPTRGSNMAELAKDSFWWHGPRWLTETETCSKTDPPSEPDFEPVLDELRTTTLTLSVTSPPRESPINLNAFNSLTKLYRLTAWILRYQQNLRFKDRRRSGELTANEILQAEIYWIRHTQKDQFQQEVELLAKEQKIQNDSKILTLHPYLDSDGLLRVNGRLKGSGLTYAERHPWVLAPKHPFTKLLVINAHEKVMHAGVIITTAALREKFWVTKSRAYVSSVIKNCNICHYFKVRASDAVMAPLPEFRSTETPAFESCGLDFAGPLFTLEEKKCYVALFTCAVTRAVHLELVPDMTTDTFLLAFRRFVSRRGMIKHLYSDNAKTFKRANTELNDLWKNLASPQISRSFANQQIHWTFIADRAAWWGGFWERLVGSVKSALRKTIGRAKLSFDEIATTLTEAEACINSRPITFTSEDVHEPAPITPNNFLLGARMTSLPSRTFPKINELPASRKELTRRLRYRQTIIDGLWKRWRAEYLLQLRSAHHRTKNNPSTPIKPGDVVLIGEEKKPRLTWDLGVIDEVFPGRDGNVRACMVRLSGGTKLRRPIQLLYRLEI